LDPNRIYQRSQDHQEQNLPQRPQPIANGGVTILSQQELLDFRLHGRFLTLSKVSVKLAKITDPSLVVAARNGSKNNE
jgi:hypothetical protein